MNEASPLDEKREKLILVTIFKKLIMETHGKGVSFNINKYAFYTDEKIHFSDSLNYLYKLWFLSYD